MIISHKYKFIFLKTRKTAGTSLEIALSKFCGPIDIITPISPPEDENIRSELGYRGPQNYNVPFAKHSLGDWKNTLRQKKRREFYNHVPASQIYRWVDKKVWDSYYKFCFERNPWDKAVSMYYFYTKTHNISRPMDVQIQAFGERLSNYSIYSIDGKVAVDYVARYEDLGNEIEGIRQKIGLPEKLILPKAKGGYRKDRRPYREVIEENEKECIRRICRKEIELLGYKF
ncbi:MAG: sulfotransferase family 2 domain-containing protein [Deltaproteobacteria bacterium]|nr:sulfotransferase family 2 domain-containing protein [Deltaproteobacteria bacterium]